MHCSGEKRCTELVEVFIPSEANRNRDKPVWDHHQRQLKKAVFFNLAINEVLSVMKI
jgi:hypothetical protein